MMFKPQSIVPLALAGVLAGCAGAKVGIQASAGGSSGNGGGGNAGSSGPTINLDATVTGPTTPVDQGAAPIACDNPTACSDFSISPILDNDPNLPSPVPSNAASQFSGSPSGSGPCVTEPEDGSLFPYNWLRPRIKWTGTSGLVQITMHADLEANDLVAYTTADHWIVPKDVWKGLSQHVHESDITVTVRAAGGAATAVKFQIASASAAGNIVFWAANPAAVGNQDVSTAKDTDSMLKGFSVGEDNTVDALKLSQIKQVSMAQSFNKRSPTCMGCHSATPDKGFVAFNDNWPWNSVIAGVTADNTGAALTNLSGGGLAALNKTWAGGAAFSSAFWKTGNRMMVTTSAQSRDDQPWSTDNKLPAKLVWYNLDSPQPTTKLNDGYQCVPGQQYGEIARNGDSNGVAFPTWSHDGQNIVYSSTNGGCMDGRLQQGATDLYVVPFNNGNGGAAKPLPGASESSYEEYYAAYSPDDQLVLFDRVPSGEVMYANSLAEIYFVPVGGASGAGKAMRLDANDPVKCTGKVTPGINNHFPKWAPAKAEWQGRSYYWVIFSSNRAGLPLGHSNYDGKDHEVSQLYLTAITVENGQYKTYHSIYLWNQTTSTLNTTPVWDIIAIPPAPPIY
jgi:WD40-like Beta Propeller Repeat.